VPVHLDDGEQGERGLLLDGEGKWQGLRLTWAFWVVAVFCSAFFDFLWVVSPY